MPPRKEDPDDAGAPTPAPTKVRWCIAHRRHDRPLVTWCGRRALSSEFTFTDTNHAAYAGLDGTHPAVSACPACVVAVTVAMTGKPLSARPSAFADTRGEE